MAWSLHLSRERGQVNRKASVVGEEKHGFPSMMADRVSIVGRCLANRFEPLRLHLPIIRSEICEKK